MGHPELNYEPVAAFDFWKAIDLIVFFAGKAEGKISKLKLIKLIYLTEREFIFVNKIPSLLDEYYSLRHGPVCSSTLNIINKTMFCEYTDNVFELRGNNIVLNIDVNEWEFDHLSVADFEAAEAVWKAHGGSTASQLRAFTHKYCPEYTHVNFGRVSIPMRSLLLLAEVPEADEVAEEIESIRRLSAIYA